MELDATDNEILLLVTKGRTSAYSVWAAMKKEIKDEKRDAYRKVMTYRNINKRVIKHAKLGLIEEIKPDAHTINIHGRKDYKVTTKGLKHLIPNIMTAEDARTITTYVDRFFKPDEKRAFGVLLVSTVISKINSANEFLGTISKHLDYASMLNIEQINQMLEPVKGYYKNLEDIYNTLYMEQTKQTHTVTLRDGSTRTVKSKLVPERRDPFFEQEEKNLERGLSYPEIADSELEEDQYRMTKPAGQSKTALTSPPARSRKKTR